jgi:hypothetical protein
VEADFSAPTAPRDQAQARKACSPALCCSRGTRRLCRLPCKLLWLQKRSARQSLSSRGLWCPEHLGGEVNVTRRVDEIDEELAAIRILGHVFVSDLIRKDLIIQRDACRFDCDAAIRLVLARVRETLITSSGHGNNSSRRDQGVREGGLACESNNKIYAESKRVRRMRYGGWQATATAKGQRITRGKNCGRLITYFRGHPRRRRACLPLAQDQRPEPSGSFPFPPPTPPHSSPAHPQGGVAPWRAHGRTRIGLRQRARPRGGHLLQHIILPRVTRTVVDVSNHGHVANLLGPVHDGAQLRYCEIHLRRITGNMPKSALNPANSQLPALSLRRPRAQDLPTHHPADVTAARAGAKNPLFLESFKMFSYLCAPIFNNGAHLGLFLAVTNFLKMQTIA